MTPHQNAAEHFVNEMHTLFNAVLPDPPGFVPVVVGDTIKIGPGPFSRSSNGSPFAKIPLPRVSDHPAGEEPRLALSVEFNTIMDPRGSGHLTIRNSTFGFWVRAGRRRNRTPAFRIEYDRDSVNKPPAHVHFHAESTEIAWAYGSSGQEMPQMSEIHYPLGGRRFRPTVEDVIRFLNSEGLYTGWKPGWSAALDKSESRWQERQAKATARNNPEAVIEQLTQSGYTVTKRPD